MIELINVKKTYISGLIEYQALKGVSFKIERGERVCVIGPSGSGKTTTMHIMGFIDSPSSGTYLLHGKEVTNLGKDELAGLRNREIGFVFQSFFLLPKLTALQNVELPLFYAGETASNSKKRAMEMIERIGMAQFALHKPNELSGGKNNE